MFLVFEKKIVLDRRWNSNSLEKFLNFHTIDILPMKEYIKTAKALKADGNHKIINKQSCHFPKPLILDKMSSS